jgi:hypothetical protein
MVMQQLRYGEDIWHYVGVYELIGGKISHATEYFGAPFPAQDFRVQWRDRDGSGEG